MTPNIVEHVDALFELTGGIKLSTIFDSLKGQMKLSAEDEQLVFGVMQETIANSIQSSFAQAGEQFKQVMENPGLQAELRARIDAMKKPKRESDD
jgi:hypothetical protein